MIVSLFPWTLWGHHMYTVGLETDSRAYFTGDFRGHFSYNPILHEVLIL